MDTKLQPKYAERRDSFQETLLRALYESATFTITRYPYICAVLLMLTTAEQSKDNEIKREEFDFVYFHVSVYFVAATCMTFDLFGAKRVFALVCVAQTLMLSYQEYNGSKYTEQVRFRLLVRNIATIGSYLMVAGGIAKNKGNADRNKLLVTFGRQIIGTFAILTATLIWNSDEEFTIYTGVFLAGEAATYVLIFALIVCSILIYSGYEVVLTCKILAILLLVITVAVDINTRAWKQTIGLETWIVLTIASRNIPVLCALVLVRKGYL